MRLPAVAIVIAFVLGITIGFWPAVSAHTTSSSFLLAGLFTAGFLVMTALFCLSRQQIWMAATISAATWVTLGIVGAGIAQQPKANNYVLDAIERGEIDVHTPLRWHGILRDEPAALPWGFSYEIDLTQVDYRDRAIPIQGGLRATYSPHSEDPSPADAHAGDAIAIVTQARLPQLFRDEGAFDRRAYLRSQGVDLTASLRSSGLLERVAIAKASPRTALARVRRRLRETVSAMLAGAPAEAAVLRAMLLGDRSFLDRDESVNFQRTGVFHVLVVAGLHVGAFATFLFWFARKLRLSRNVTSVAVAVFVLCYVAVVEQRPPVLRAALMTFAIVLALIFFRRVELLNSVAIAALILLVASPSLLADSSFQLSFLSMFCIAGLAAPWLDKTIEPYARGMRGWRDVTRDVSHEPLIAQFRIDLRSIAAWIELKLPGAIATRATQLGAKVLSVIFRVTEMVVLTVVLQIGMLPLLARDFHRVTLSGPLANLIAVPLTGILVPLGFFTLMCGLLFHRAAILLAMPLRWLTALLLHSINWVAHFSRWSYRIPGPPFWLVCVFFGAAIVLAGSLLDLRVSRASAGTRLTSLRAIRFKHASFTVALAAALLMAIYPFAPRWQRGSLELTVLDVGQGDSLFVVSPLGHTILVDGGGSFTSSSDPMRRSESRGPDPGEDAVSRYLWSRGFKQLDTVALTHAHQDHIGGLTAILENFNVKTLWIGREVESSQQRQLEALASSKGTRVVHQLRGNHFAWDEAQTEFVWPEIAPQEIASSAKNDDSLVFRMSYRDRSFLLPGDAEQASERSMLSENALSSLQSDVLKVGHHGSKNSTTLAFLAAVQPRLAVISAGEENPYGHPSPVLLKRLAQAGVPTLRTDVSGAIHIFTDGKKLEVSCFIACPEITAQVNLPRVQPPQNQETAQQQ
jgi:competence protein ComEC